MMRVLATVFLSFLGAVALAAEPSAVSLRGEAVQGGLVFGQAPAGSRAALDGTAIMVSPSGAFVIGFGRDETGIRTLTVISPGGEPFEQELTISKREYDIERVDGLPPRTVTPDPAATERIQREAALVSSARAKRDERMDFAETFAWPARGRISGVYGSQRVLNGEPRRPHYGLDIAAPTGSPVYAPASGVITLAEKDLYFSGGTIILDHGHGLNSSFLHLSEVLVEPGDYVNQGDLIARIGATGRASGPHLDWRMNWLDRRVDPQLLVEGSPEP